MYKINKLIIRPWESLSYRIQKKKYKPMIQNDRYRIKDNKVMVLINTKVNLNTTRITQYILIKDWTLL